MTFAAGEEKFLFPRSFFVWHISRSDLYCEVNVPAETGKMSRSDKRGATLPKVATVALLLRKDGVGQCFPYRGKWHGVPIEVMYESFIL